MNNINEMQSDQFSPPIVFDGFLLDENVRESDVWADMHGDDMDDGGVDLFGNMDCAVGEDMGYMSSDETVQHLESSSPGNIESSSPKYFELSSPKYFEASSPKYFEASSPKCIQASSLEHVEVSAPKQLATSSYALTLMLKQNYKGVASAGITKNSTIAKNFVTPSKRNAQIKAKEIPMQRLSADHMMQLKQLDIKYNTSGEIVQMYKSGVGKIYRIYDPDELYFDKRTGETRTLTTSELAASSEEFKRVEKKTGGRQEQPSVFHREDGCATCEDPRTRRDPQ